MFSQLLRHWKWYVILNLYEFSRLSSTCKTGYTNRLAIFYYCGFSLHTARRNWVLASKINVRLNYNWVALILCWCYIKELYLISKLNTRFDYNRVSLKLLRWNWKGLYFYCIIWWVKAILKNVCGLDKSDNLSLPRFVLHDSYRILTWIISLFFCLHASKL